MNTRPLRENLSLTPMIHHRDRYQIESDIDRLFILKYLNSISYESMIFMSLESTRAHLPFEI